MSMFLVFPEISQPVFCLEAWLPLAKAFPLCLYHSKRDGSDKELGYMCIILSRPWYSKFATSILYIFSGMTLDRPFNLFLLYFRYAILTS